MDLIKLIASIMCALVFVCVAVFHYYWAFGGKVGINVVLPELEQTSKKVFVPGKFATFVVATLFLGIAIAYFIIGFNLHPTIVAYKLYFLVALCAITFIRAVGDFKYAGFFKKVKHSQFANYDTQYFSPLCLTISIITALQL